MRKHAAVKFLEMTSRGQAVEAATRFLAPNGVHHNPHVEAGWPALVKAMDENHERFPQKVLEVQRVLADGDLVAVHSKVVLDPQVPIVNVVHILRFEGAKIVELWDIGAQVPAGRLNVAGAF
jgi:predicted SnoaL-like aldol condensation-catalyzing enzyme